MRVDFFLNNSKMKQTIKTFVKKLLFFIFFLFVFLYIFFPNTMLKNYILSEIRLAAARAEIPINIDMESAKLYWLTGLQFKKISVSSIYTPYEKNLTIPNLTVRLSVLPLLWTHANINLDMDLKKGSSEFSASFSIFELIKNNVQNFEVNGEFKNFEIHDIIQEGLNIFLSSNKTSLALLRPILANINFGGRLNGEIQLNSKENSNSGLVNLNFEELFFDLNDPHLNISTQHFKKSGIDIVWNNSNYEIKDNTNFESENLYFKPKGFVRMVGVSPNSTPVLNMDMLIILSGAIEKNFGFLIPQLLNCPSASMTGGVMNVKLVGPISQYICQ